MNISGDTGVLVTGGASGLGLAVVEKFVSLGAKVAIFDMNEEEGSKIASKLGITFLKSIAIFGFIFEYIIPLPTFLRAIILPSGEIITVCPKVSLLIVFFPV